MKTPKHVNVNTMAKHMLMFTVALRFYVFTSHVIAVLRVVSRT